MPPKNICNAKSNRIILRCWFKKSSYTVLQPPEILPHYQSRLNMGRMLGFHKIHLTTYQTGDVINIFASVWVSTNTPGTTVLDQLVHCCVKLRRQAFLNFTPEPWWELIGFVFANTQPFSYFVQTAWVKHMQVCLQDMCNFCISFS